MIFNNIDLDDLSRDDYINLILFLMRSFKLIFNQFNDVEKTIINCFLEDKWKANVTNI